MLVLYSSIDAWPNPDAARISHQFFMLISVFPVSQASDNEQECDENCTTDYDVVFDVLFHRSVV